MHKLSRDIVQHSLGFLVYLPSEENLSHDIRQAYGRCVAPKFKFHDCLESAHVVNKMMSEIACRLRKRDVRASMIIFCLPVLSNENTILNDFLNWMKIYGEDVKHLRLDGWDSPDDFEEEDPSERIHELWSAIVPHLLQSHPPEPPPVPPPPPLGADMTLDEDEDPESIDMDENDYEEIADVEMDEFLMYEDDVEVHDSNDETEVELDEQLDVDEFQDLIAGFRVGHTEPLIDVMRQWVDRANLGSEAQERVRNVLDKVSHPPERKRARRGADIWCDIMPGLPELTPNLETLHIEGHLEASTPELSRLIHGFVVHWNDLKIVHIMSDIAHAFQYSAATANKKRIDENGVECVAGEDMELLVTRFPRLTDVSVDFTLPESIQADIDGFRSHDYEDRMDNFAHLFPAENLERFTVPRFVTNHFLVRLLPRMHNVRELTFFWRLRAPSVYRYSTMWGPDAIDLLVKSCPKLETLWIYVEDMDDEGTQEALKHAMEAGGAKCLRKVILNTPVWRHNFYEVYDRLREWTTELGFTKSSCANVKTKDRHHIAEFTFSYLPSLEEVVDSNDSVSD